MVFWFAAPLALSGLLFGAAFAMDANDEREKTRRLQNKTADKHKRATDKYALASKKAQQALHSLGVVRAEIAKNELSEFVVFASQWRTVHFPQPGPNQNLQGLINRVHSISQTVQQTARFEQTVSNALAAGGLAASATTTAYGAMAMFGAASTGTAISALSGVTASNATLAAFGGGALAAGGFGILGGMAALGGIGAAAFLPIFTFLDVLNAEKEHSNAKTQSSLVQEQIDRLKTVREMLDQAKAIAEQYEHATIMLGQRLKQELNALENMSRHDVMNTTHGRATLSTAFQLAETLAQAISQPLIDENYQIFDECLELLQCLQSN